MENKIQEPFDYEKAKQKGKEQLRSGKSLFSKDGAFAPLLQEMLNSILEGEIEGHLDEEEQRGVDDILIACIDNPKGFDQAIGTIFPHTEVQKLHRSSDPKQY